jgi:ATP/ADP translocase
MRADRVIGKWLDVRPGESKRLWLLTLGAFLLIGFVVLCRSFRESSFLESFDVKSLPYLKVGQALLALPAVLIFSELLRSRDPRKLVKGLILLLSAAVIVLWPAAKASQAGVVAFFLVAALGALLLASGFWVVAAGCFAVRGAKRLFGIIIAGGTAGGMVVGLSASWLVVGVGTVWWGSFLVLPLVLLYVVISLLPGRREAAPDAAGDVEKDGVSTEGSLSAIWRTPYLRAMALILLAATAASAVVDFQFLKYVDRMASEESRAAFLGSFYGWAGAVALAIQLLVASRLLSSAGVGLGLCMVPAFLLLGSTALLAAPGLLVATALRGGDYSLRKSLLRPMIEFLYVPLPEALRRRTKTFIDVVVDSAGEVTGSLVVLLLFNLAGVPVEYLAFVVAGIALYLFMLSRRMGSLYLDQIVERLSAGERTDQDMSLGRMLQETHILTASFSRLDIQSLLAGSVRESAVRAAKQEIEGTECGEGGGSDGLAALRSANRDVVLDAIDEIDDWSDEHIGALARLLVRNGIREKVEAKLVELGERTAGHLSKVLVDESADFVLRRRIPRVLAGIGGDEAIEALLSALSCGRFEVRYRSAIALVRLRKWSNLAVTPRRGELVWRAVRREVESNRPIWEMQRLLDDMSLEEEDELVIMRVGVRGELSLEHTFRMLTLVLDPEPVRAAFHGIILDDESLKSFALEYLEQVLPAAIRERLWLFIGDISEYRRAKEMRPMNSVVSDLMSSRATLFGGEADRDALKRLLGDKDGK